MYTQFPQNILNMMRESRVPLFLKNDNRVLAAHITPIDGQTIGDSWSEDRLLNYLTEEGRLNHNRGAGPSSLYIGDAKYHSWVLHFRYRHNSLEGGYEWERLL